QVPQEQHQPRDLLRPRESKRRRGRQCRCLLSEVGGPLMRNRVPGLIAMALVFGCGADDGFGRRWPVRGTVTYNGQPLEAGRITFDPVATDGSARVAAGTIRDGSYTLSTAGGDDGALPGKYQVAIVSRTADYSKVQGITEGGAARQSDVFNAT